VPGGPFTATALTTAGAATLAAALVAGTGLGLRRAVLLLPAVTIGALLLATGAEERWLGWDSAVFVTSALVVIVIAEAWSAGLAARISGWGSGSRSGDAERESRPVDLERIAAEAGAAHHVMAATAASVGVVLALAAAPAMSLGAAGVATELLACLVVLLRTRHVHARAPLVAGLGSGLVGVVATTVSVLWLHPAWRQPAALGLGGTGLALLGCVALPGSRATMPSRLADGVEGLAHVVLVPTLAVATGVLSLVLRP
jgi:hypothetical protein